MSECEMCLNYVYDDDDEEYVCEADIDEDDMAHMWGGRRRHCPYWRSSTARSSTSPSVTCQATATPGISWMIRRKNCRMGRRRPSRSV